MSYFSKFPLLAYDIANTETYKVLPDILRRVKLRSAIVAGQMIFDKYDVQEGEKPEDVAYKWFGDAEFHWVILMTNNITDRFYQWPLTQAQFHEYIEDKYADPDAIHHYEITKTSGITKSQGPGDYSYLVECNSDEAGALPITNREYEQRQQDSIRQIKLLDKKYLGAFVEEFNNLIAQ